MENQKQTLQKLKEKRSEIDSRIKKIEDSIRQLELEKKAKDYERLEVKCVNNNIDISALFEAIDKKDISSIEKILKQGAEKVEG